MVIKLRAKKGNGPLDYIKSYIVIFILIRKCSFKIPQGSSFITVIKIRFQVSFNELAALIKNIPNKIFLSMNPIGT